MNQFSFRWRNFLKRTSFDSTRVLSPSWTAQTRASSRGSHLTSWRVRHCDASCVFIVLITAIAICCFFVAAGGLRDRSKMRGVLDLGGGSTQITFVPTNQASSRWVINLNADFKNYFLLQDTIKNAPPGYLINQKLQNGESVKVYTHR